MLAPGEQLAAAALVGAHRLALSWPDGCSRLVDDRLACHPAATSAEWATGKVKCFSCTSAKSTLAKDVGSRRSMSPSPVLDLSCHGHEGLLDIGCVLGTGLQEGDANLICKSLRANESLGA